MTRNQSRVRSQTEVPSPPCTVHVVAVWAPSARSNHHRTSTTNTVHSPRPNNHHWRRECTPAGVDRWDGAVSLKLVHFPVLNNRGDAETRVSSDETGFKRDEWLVARDRNRMKAK